MNVRSVVLLVASGLLVACTGVDPSERTAEGLLLAPPAGTDGLQLSLHAPPGLEEATRRCHVVILPGGDGTDVEAVEHRLSAGAREVRLYHSDLDVDGAWSYAGLALCDELAQHRTTLAYASSDAAGGVSLPTGVALHFAPLEVLVLEVSFDAGAGAAKDEANVNLWFSQLPPTSRTDAALSDEPSPAR